MPAKTNRSKALLVLAVCAALLLVSVLVALGLSRRPAEEPPVPTPMPVRTPVPTLSPEPTPAYTRSEAEDADSQRAAVAEGAQIGRLWVEGTEIDCALYWGDSGSQFSKGAGAHSLDGCVLPGQAGTLFVGAHTDTYFADMPSVKDGAVIHIETDWGTYLYRVTEQKQITETDIDACHWGEDTERCILYTCYPFGILTPTEYRWLAYAEPVDAAG